MQIANVRLRLNKVGSDVPVVGCTPAEALVLHVLHQGNNGGSTFGDEMDKINILPGEASIACDEPAKPAVGEVGKPGYVAAVPARKERPRTDAEELRRLKRKYGHCVTKKGDSILGKIWPGIDAKLPQKFSDLDYSKLSFDGLEVASLDLASGKPVTTNAA